MKFALLNLLKAETKKIPSLKSLHPPFYNVKLAWFTVLGLVVLLFLVSAFIGFKLAYDQYFESYKESQFVEDYNDLIDVEKLKNVINQRETFLNQTLVLPKDPSL